MYALDDRLFGFEVLEETRQNMLMGFSIWKRREVKDSIIKRCWPAGEVPGGRGLVLLTKILTFPLNCAHGKLKSQSGICCESYCPSGCSLTNL